MSKGGYVYILTNKNNTVFYTGVTANLEKRLYEHQHHIHLKSFTQRYNCTKLVYYAHFDNIQLAIAEEKRIKAGTRMKKLELIDKMNPDWNDLTGQVMGFNE